MPGFTDCDEDKYCFLKLLFQCICVHTGTHTYAVYVYEQMCICQLTNLDTLRTPVRRLARVGVPAGCAPLTHVTRKPCRCLLEPCRSMGCWWPLRDAPGRADERPIGATFFPLSSSGTYSDLTNLASIIILMSKHRKRWHPNPSMAE